VVQTVVGFASYVKTEFEEERTEALAKLAGNSGRVRTGRRRALDAAGGGGGGGRGTRRWPVGRRADGTRPCPVETPGAPAPQAVEAGVRRRAGGSRKMRGWMPLSAEKSARTTTSGWRRSNAKFPAAGRANVKDFVNHIDYAVEANWHRSRGDFVGLRWGAAG